MALCLVKHRDKFSCAFILAEHHAVKAYWGSGCIAPRILYLGTRWSGQLHAPAALPPEKEPLVPIG
jgi:hypothetical protein